MGPLSATGKSDEELMVKWKKINNGNVKKMNHLNKTDIKKIERKDKIKKKIVKCKTEKEGRMM